MIVKAKILPIRLRPILMTAVSMIFGVLPVALALGEGAEARAPMAGATVGDMTTSMILTLFVIPVVYALMDQVAGWFTTKAGEKVGPRSTGR